MDKNQKRAFLIVNLGTDYQEGRQLAINNIGNKMQSDLPEYEVRQAFVSHDLIDKLAEFDGIEVDDERRALERLREEGFTEVIVQPFQVAAGEEYERIRDVVQDYIELKEFGKIETLPCLTVWAKQIHSMSH